MLAWGILWMLPWRLRRRPGQQWNGWSKVLIGAEIIDASITDRSSRLVLQQGKRTHLLELKQDGAQEAARKRGDPNASHLDAWVISQTDRLMC